MVASAEAEYSNRFAKWIKGNDIGIDGLEEDFWQTIYLPIHAFI